MKHKDHHNEEQMKIYENAITADTHFYDHDFDITVTNPIRLYDQAVDLGVSHNACFVYDGFTPDDIKQGGVGDCWFLSALAALVGHKERTKRVIVV